MRLWIIPVLTPLVSAALLLAGIAALGRQAEESLRADAAYKISFGDVVCDTPGALAREEFLREVQYDSDLPDELERLDWQLAALLETAFARHPWVEKVERIEVNADGVEVRLAFREPVLAVAGPERLHAVSADGVLLPRAAVSPDLPRLNDPGSRPAGRTGQPWGSPGVESAARVANLLRYRKDHAPVVSMEFCGKDLVLWTKKGSRIVWGQPLESEAVAEPPAGIGLPGQPSLVAADSSTKR